MTIETGAVTAAVAIAMYVWSGNTMGSSADFSLFVLHFLASVHI